MSDISEPVWTHPKLGKLTLSLVDSAWVGEVELPSFAKFDLPLPVGRYELMVEPRSFKEDYPSEQLIDAMLAAIDIESELADSIPVAIYRDLMGESPKPGSCWHGELADGKIPILLADSPNSATDLLVHLEFARITSRRAPDMSPLVSFQFCATWVDEGSLGVLVDDGNVIGIGPIAHLRPFGGFSAVDSDEGSRP